MTEHAMSDSSIQFLATQEELSGHTSFRIGGPAEFFFRPACRPELVRTIGRCRRAGLPVRVLGGGTNLLVSDRGVAGAVVATTAVRHMSISTRAISAECGTRITQLVKAAAACGLSGLEPLAGVPGTLGGAIRMNAGTGSGCIGDVIDEITVLAPDGRLQNLRASQAGFAYRSSKLGDCIVLAARLKLQLSEPERIRRAVLANLGAKAASQPLREASAGCIFKNPAGDSAGRIIDSLALKGAAMGGALISPRHANFIVNTGWAASADVLALIELVRNKVLHATGVHLELEIDVW